MAGYVIEHEGRQFDPNGEVKVDDASAHNRDLEAAELAHWKTRPDRWQGYVVGSAFTTFLGSPMGEVISERTYTNNLGRITSVRIRGNNGATYYGRLSADWSQFVRVRKAKGV